jgi:dihydroorotase
MLSVGLRLVHSGAMTLSDLLRALSARPASILGVPGGRLARGAPADLILLDPDEPYVLDPATLHSRCRNTPFDGARLQGRVMATYVDGRPVLPFPTAPSAIVLR